MGLIGVGGVGVTKLTFFSRSTKGKMIDLSEHMELHKQNAHHLQDKLHKTEGTLEKTSAALFLLRRKHKTTVSALEKDLLDLNHYANRMENQLAAASFTGRIMSAAGSKVQTKWDDCEAENARLEEKLATTREKLATTLAKLKEETKVGPTERESTERSKGTPSAGLGLLIL